jgi:outer membrane protein
MIVSPRSARWSTIAFAMWWLSACLACAPKAAHVPTWAKPPDIPAPVSAPEQPSTPPASKLIPPAGEAASADVQVPDRIWDLPSLVDFALAHNPRTRLSWAQSQAAAAAMGRTNASFYPTIDLEGSVLQSRASVPFLGQARSQTVLGPAATLNYVLYDFGARAAISEEARNALLAANLNHNEEIQVVTFQVQEAYYRLAGTRAMLAAREAGLREAKESLDAAQERHSTGTATIADVAQAKAALSLSQLQLQTELGQVEIERGVLAAVVGWAPNVSLKTLDLPSGPPAGEAEAGIELLLQKAKEERPDLASLQAEASSAEARIKWTKARALPVLSVTAGAAASFNSIRQSSASDSYLSPEYYVGATLRFPLFTGHEIEYTRQQARFDLEAAKERGRLLEQQIGIEVWTSYYELRTAADRVKTSAELLASAQQSYEVNLGRYEAGVGDILQVLSAQAVLEEARSQEIRSRTDWYLAAARLAYSTGTLMTNR